MPYTRPVAPEARFANKVKALVPQPTSRAVSPARIFAASIVHARSFLLCPSVNNSTVTS